MQENIHFSNNIALQMFFIFTNPTHLNINIAISVQYKKNMTDR